MQFPNFVFQNFQDNQPFSIMEAQVTGKPVVVSDAGGISEMVEHEKTDLIVPAGDSDLLYKCLESLLADDQLSNHAQQTSFLSLRLKSQISNFRVLTDCLPFSRQYQSHKRYVHFLKTYWKAVGLRNPNR